MLRPVSSAELQFELHEEIGHEGKNSKVFKARDLQLEAPLVIKRIEKSQFTDIDDFFKEASNLYMSMHPNVVPIYYGCYDSDHIFLSMPWFAKGSLKSLMSSRMLTVREIITYSTQVLAALQNIHSKGLIHFDVKPDNILLSDRGEALLSDFGLAKQTCYSGTAFQDRIYGPMTPPEALQTNGFNIQFDIYQMGLTMYRMCVGEKQFYENLHQYFENGTIIRSRFRHAVLNGQFPDKNCFPEHIPQKMIDTVKTCLASDLSQRYTSAVAVVNSLSEIDGELLDWQMEYEPQARKWRKETKDGKIFQILVDDDFKSAAEKTSNTGRTQRVRDYCLPKINRADIKRFLRKY